MILRTMVIFDGYISVDSIHLLVILNGFRVMLWKRSCQTHRRTTGLHL